MKKDKEIYVCRKRKIGEIIEIECGSVKKEKEPKKKMFCVFGTKGKSGGATGLGFGAQYGEQDTTIKCFSEDELKDEVAKKLGTKKDNIKWINREE